MEYHKIHTLWDRDQSTKHKTLIEGQWARPEFAYLVNNQWIWTEKVDGTNIRVIWDGEKVTYGGRTEEAQIYAPLIQVLQEKCSAETLGKVLTGPAILYGEGYGAKIQKVGALYKPDGVDFVLFDVWCGSVWLRRDDVDDIAEQLSIESVPVVRAGTLMEAIEWVRKGHVSEWGNFPAEGLVVRPETELLDRQGQRIIGKIKGRDFLQ